ncbi:hypothetical protein DD572_16070, partial [Klebsiella pneumoniae]
MDRSIRSGQIHHRSGGERGRHHADAGRPSGRRRTAAVGGLQTRPWRGDCLPAYQQFRRSVDLSDNSPAVSL